MSFYSRWNRAIRSNIDSQLPSLISLYIFVWSISEVNPKNNWMRGEQACLVVLMLLRRCLCLTNWRIVNIIRDFFWKSQFFLWPAVGLSNLFALLEPSPAEEISTESVLSFSIESSFSSDWTAAPQQEFSHQSWCQEGRGNRVRFAARFLMKFELVSTKPSKPIMIVVPNC